MTVGFLVYIIQDMNRKEKVCGIYKITNLINGKCYIGKAKNIYKRFWSHKNNAEKTLPDRRSSPLLFYAIKKYHIDNFKFEILEETVLDEDILKERELYWMDYYNSYENCCGYNLRRDSSTNMIVHKKTSEKISNRLKLEWENGVRKEHSQKLKDSWDGDEKRRQEQSTLLSEILTKYQYNIYSLENEFIKTVLYKELKDFGLKNCNSTFHRKGVNIIKFKNFIVEKILIQ